VSTTVTPAPYCAHIQGGGSHCYRRTKHDSGLCPQHRPGRNGRGQEPMSTRGILACHVDESGGMAELTAAEALLTDAYGPGSWVTNGPEPAP
jgi:hypothetical protein